MEKKIVAINGDFYARKITGIERVGIEVTKCLDEFVHPGQMELIVPKDAEGIPDFKNITVVRLDVDKNIKQTKWTQGPYQKYVRKNNRWSMNYSNTCPYFSPGFEFIHDIYTKLYKGDMKSLRDKIIGKITNLLYWRIAKKARIIFTVSEYSKKTIVDTYGTNPDKIKVVYSGIHNTDSLDADFSIFERIPELKNREFYFTLGSLSLRKNLKWIADHAELYPDELFAISGKALPTVVPPELEKMKKLKNILMCGYLNDEEVKALEMKAKAFIFPSYFEGFGLPPLETLACGGKIIISNSSCLPEIYGNTAWYIDPDNPNVNLNELRKKPVEGADSILKKFTFMNTASRIHEAIRGYLV